MYRNIHEYDIRYSDVDAYDNLKLSALLGFMQESACYSADELGFGYEVISKRNAGFILANWYLDLSRPLKLGEKVEIHTWPIKPSHLIFIRDFEIYSGGEKVGVASSRWCMIHTQDYSLIPINSYFEEGFFDGYNTERSVEVVKWKIPEACGSEKVYSRRVMYSDYDHYFHVNNIRYADFLMDVFSVWEMAGKYVKSAQISYDKQCKEGDIIDCFLKRDGNTCYIEGRVGDELRVQLKVELRDL